MNRKDIHVGTEYAYQEGTYSTPRRVRVLDEQEGTKTVYRDRGWSSSKVSFKGWKVVGLDAAGNPGTRHVSEPRRTAVCPDCKGKFADDFTCQVCANEGIVVTKEAVEGIVPDEFVAESRQLIATWAAYVEQRKAKLGREAQQALARQDAKAAAEALTAALKAAGLGGYAHYDYPTASVKLTLGAESANRLAAAITPKES